MDQNNIIKASEKDKEQTQTLLHAVIGKPIFKEKLEAINELFKEAVIIDPSNTST